MSFSMESRRITQWFFSGLLLISTGVVFAQTPTCSCADALEQTWRTLQELPAYQDRCADAASCELRYRELRAAAPAEASGPSCYRILSDLTALLGDGHTIIYGSVADTLQPGRRLTDFPSPPAGTASGPEGIYYLGAYSFSLTPMAADSAYLLSLRTSPDDRWREGDTVAFLTSLGDNRFRYAGHQLRDGRLVTRIEAIRHGAFARMGLRRDTTQRDVSRVEPGDTYRYRKLPNNTDYIRLGSFESFQPTLARAETFYAGLSPKLTGQRLIVDLRDNGGGGKRNSDILYRILKKRRKQYGDIAVLINHNTVSNAEQFAIRLQSWKNVTLAGERTAGILAYELESSVTEIPCGEYVTQLATKRLRRYLPYERLGVKPDLTLDPASPWPRQIEEWLDQE